MKNKSRMVIAKGKQLDIIGRNFWMERKKKKIFFGLITIKESDKEFRLRMMNYLSSPWNRTK